jgi:phosphonate transport system substrate-binding protein
MNQRIIRARLIFLVVFPLLISLSLVGRPQPILAEEIYKVAIQSDQLPVEQWVKFRPLNAYLEERAKAKFELIMTRSFGHHFDLVQGGEVDFSYQDPYVFLQLWEYALPLVLTEKEKKWGIECRGVIITRKDSGINTIKDLKGKTVSVSSLHSADGFIAQKVCLRGTLDVDTDLVVVKTPGNVPQDVISDVVMKKVDAGFASEEVLTKAKRSAELSQQQIMDIIKIIAYTDYIPNWIFSANKGVPARVRDMVQNSLLDIPVDDPILTDIEVRRLVPIPTNYLEQYKAKIEGR